MSLVRFVCRYEFILSFAIVVSSLWFVPVFYFRKMLERLK